MDFGEIPLEQAEGAVLAHSVALAKGRLRKGQRLGPGEIAQLREAGHAEITAARLAPGDVDEDTAARRLAEALCGAGLRLTEAATGRVNALAEGPGVARIDAEAVAAVNAVDPMITVATLPEWQRCEERTMVATVKIISYAIPEEALARACAVARNALELRHPVIGEAVLIETLVGEGPAKGKGEEVTRDRLERLGARLTETVRVPHETAPLAEAIAARSEPLILILTGSATSDWHDTAPEALRRAGGEVAHFGMPVDPGNLLFLGALGGRPVIGLPGCARAPALNGADWVLERIVCGVPVGPSEIAAMGVGGLLKEIPTRPRPRHHR